MKIFDLLIWSLHLLLHICEELKYVRRGQGWWRLEHVTESILVINTLSGDWVEWEMDDWSNEECLSRNWEKISHFLNITVNWRCLQSSILFYIIYLKFWSKVSKFSILETSTWEIRNFEIKIVSRKSATMSGNMDSMDTPLENGNCIKRSINCCVAPASNIRQWENALCISTALLKGRMLHEGFSRAGNSFKFY